MSLAREAQQASSILNALPARIVSKTAIGPSEVLAVLALGPDGGGAKLLARLTRRSWDLLELAEGMAVIAQVKGVALAPARGQVAADGAALAAPTRPA